MRRRGVRRALTAAAVVVFGVAAVFTAGLMLESRNGVEETQRFGDAEMPTALAAHLEDLAKTSPGNEGLEEEGPSSAAESAFLERAYPADTISVAQMQGGGRGRGREGEAVPGRQGAEGHMGHGRAERGALSVRAVPELVQLRAQRVRRGWTDDLDRTGRVVQARRLPCVHHAGRRRRLADEERADRRAELGVPRRPARDQRGRRVYLDPNDPSGNTVYVGTGEANICGSGCVAGVGLYKSTNGGDSLDAARRQHARRQGHRRDRRQAGRPEHDLRRRRPPRCAACRPSAAPA